MGALTSAAHPSTHHTCDGALGGVERCILQKLSPPPHVRTCEPSIQRPRRSVTLSMIMSSFQTFSLRCCVEIIAPTGTVPVWTPRTHRGAFGDVSLLQNTSHIPHPLLSAAAARHQHQNSNLRLRLSFGDLSISSCDGSWILWVLKDLPCLGHQPIKL